MSAGAHRAAARRGRRARPRRLPAGRGRHRQDDGAGRSLLRGRARPRGRGRRHPRLHLHRAGGGPASQPGPRGALRSRPEAEGEELEALREAAREATERAWISTIHGFCRRLLALPSGRGGHRSRASGSSTRPRRSGSPGAPSTLRSRSWSRAGERRGPRAGGRQSPSHPARDDPRRLRRAAQPRRSERRPCPEPRAGRPRGRDRRA